MDEIIYLLSTTFNKKDDAERIVESLLEQELIACAQLSGPITSMYRWKGQVEKEQEYKLEVKTLEKHFGKVKEVILSLHPYDTPELLGAKTASCNEQYLAWMNEVIQ